MGKNEGIGEAGQSKNKSDREREKNIMEQITKNVPARGYHRIQYKMEHKQKLGQ